MSSNIRVNRICHHCGNDFVAKTTTTQYCSHKCSRAAYKARERNVKVQASNEETRSIKLSPIEEIKAKDFLTVKDVAKLINCSARTAYRLVSTGVIPAVAISERKTIIRRVDLDKLFESPVARNEKPKSVGKHFEIEDCYSLKQIESKYKLKERVIHEVIKRNGIPKLKKGWYTYVPKELIDEALNPKTTR